MEGTKIKNSRKWQKTTKLPNYNAIDKKLVERIDELSKADRKIWNAPKHNRRDNVHGFFQYPAMMVPVVQKEIIDAVLFVRPEINTMFDPFMGSATSIVAAMQCGLNCFGQDINPLAVLLSKVKTGGYYYDSFKKRAEVVIATARKSKSEKIVSNFKGRDKWFKKSVSIELSRLVQAIRKEDSINARRLFWVTLAETVRLTSNDRTSTFKLHVRNKAEIRARNISPIEIFELLIGKNISDIESHSTILKERGLLQRGLYKNTISISLLDSLSKVKQPNSIDGGFDLLVSSPPYGDNKTTIPYGQHAYLPLQWIDLHDIEQKVSNDLLRTQLEIDSRSLGGTLKKYSINEVDILFDKSPTLEKTIKQLGGDHSDKVRKVFNFIFDFDKSLDLIVKSVKTNGYFVWTIGNRNVGNMEIKNDKILIELMSSRGAKLVKVINRKILNKRMALRNDTSTTMNKEKILIFRKESAK